MLFNMHWVAGYIYGYFFSSTKKRYLSLSICITQGASPLIAHMQPHMELHIVATALPTSLSVTMECVYLTATDVITMMTVETIAMKRAVVRQIKLIHPAPQNFVSSEQANVYTFDKYFISLGRGGGVVPYL